MKINNKYSLSNTNDYKHEIEFSTKEAISLYIILVVEYCNIIKDKIKYKKCDYFVIIRGLDTLTYVFKIIMLYTKNLEYVCCYTQKAFYYYIEFITQTSEMERLFLQMTSRDAVIYVYKKTICEINKNFMNPNITSSATTIEKITETIFIIRLPITCDRKFSKAFKPRSKTRLILTGISPNAKADKVRPR